MGSSSSVEPSISVSRKVTAPFGSFRRGCSCALTKPMGTIPCFLLALSSRMRALSRAPSSSKATWLNRARAFRTCRRVVDRQDAVYRASRCMRSRYREALLAPSHQAVACPDDRKNRRGPTSAAADREAATKIAGPATRTLFA